MNVDIMLKNRTKEQIKRKFVLKPTLFNPLPKNIETKNIEKEELTDHHNSAYINVPNYLEPPGFKNSKPLLICLFQIVMEGMTPFLLYLLQKNGSALDLVNFDTDTKNVFLERDSVEYMNNIITDGEISYAGFIETKEHNVLILKYVSTKDFKLIVDNYHWATPHELVNLQAVIDIPIAKYVTQLFLNNTALLILKNDNDVIYETPVIGYYVGSKEGRLDEMDIYREIKNDKYGKCYYFHMKMPDKSNRIMRTVLFLQRTGLMNNIFDSCNSIIYRNNNTYFFLIKKYEQHTVIAYH